jgi:hypothetical protein
MWQPHAEVLCSRCMLPTHHQLVSQGKLQMLRVVQGRLRFVCSSIQGLCNTECSLHACNAKCREFFEARCAQLCGEAQWLHMHNGKTHAYGVWGSCVCCRYWNKVNFEGMKQSFADGGGTDNLAVTPLLRRKVSTCTTGMITSRSWHDQQHGQQW